MITDYSNGCELRETMTVANMCLKMATMYSVKMYDIELANLRDLNDFSLDDDYEVVIVNFGMFGKTFDAYIGTTSNSVTIVDASTGVLEGYSTLDRLLYMTKPYEKSDLFI
ncbi:hypothetical protein ACED23_09050 [Vibrio splendidus]|uniref:Uncharacterized protein n=1 Tax=Vibrio splendidus TaxID=29497 RepID=A0ABV4LPH3_VIBSP